MHKLNILIFGPDSFIYSLNELKSYFNFNIISNQKNLSLQKRGACDGFICHEEKAENNEVLEFFKTNNCFKILASNKNIKLKNFDDILKLPASIDDVNKIIENSAVKKQFNKNSSILIKSYTLDKNEKKLIKENKFIILTEKEIQLLEILLVKKDPISKIDILSQVWNYSNDTDTHTVETHIYRLRKKINEKFSDENFILNNKYGYYL